MFHLFKFVGRWLRRLFVFVLVLCALIVVVLSVTDVPLPARVLNHITTRLSTPSTAFAVQSASIGLRKGLTLGNAQIRMNLATNDLFVQVHTLAIDLAIRPGRTWTEWIEGFRLVRPKAHFLPPLLPRRDEEFVPGLFLRNLQLSRISVVLEEPAFAGIAPTRVVADFSLRSQSLLLENIRAEWQAADPEFASGTVLIDPVANLIDVTANGRISQQHVRPILVLIDAPIVLHYCDNITSPEAPLTVALNLRFTPSIETYHFEIEGRDMQWRGIPVTRTVCVIDAVNPVGQDAWNVTLSPLTAVTPRGSAEAVLVYTETNGCLFVEARAAMPPPDLFEIIEVLNDGTLDRIRFNGIPHVTLSGTVDADSTRDIPYNLNGTIQAPDVDLYGLPLTQTTCDLAIREEWRVSFNNIHATLPHGGEISGAVSLDLTEAEAGVPFRADLAFSEATLRDLFKPINQTNDWEGFVAGNIALDGNFTTNVVESFFGEGAFSLSGAVISRVPLFAGFTDFMARNIPGVDLLVSQSDASLSCRVKNGNIRSDDILVEGGFFSISGKGGYDMAQDMLDVTAHANIFRRGSIVGTITRLITLPFDRLLLEFRVFGPVGAPAWNYKGILQRIVDTVSGSKSDKPDKTDKQDQPTNPVNDTP